MQNPFDQFDDTPQPVMPTVVPLPESPRDRFDRQIKTAAEVRAQQDQARQQQQFEMSQRGERRTVSNEMFNDAGKLRDDFSKQPQVKEYQTVIRQYATALNTKPTPTGDQALITAYAKMLDPTSVVREQEFNTVASADSAIGKAYAKLSKELGMEESGLLRSEIRERVRAEMLNLTKGYNQSYNQLRQFYGGLAERNGISPADVIGPHLGEPYLPQIEKTLTQQRAMQSRPVVQSDPRGELQQDGTFVKDGGAYDRKGGFLGLAGSVTDEGPSGDGNDPNGGYADSVLGQGVYGLNEGLASTLGAPVDLTTMGLNLIPQGINAIANTNLPQIEDPFLGGEWWKDRFSDLGSIGPQTQNTAGQVARRTGQSIGAAALPVAGTSSKLAAAARALGVAAGGGVGAATAQQVFPGNPVAEFAGELAGSGLTAAGLVNGSRQSAYKAALNAIPSRDELKQQATNLYAAAESRGVVAGPNVTSNLAGRIQQIAKDEGLITPKDRPMDSYPKAKDAHRLLSDYAGSDMDVKQIQVVRDTLSDAVRGTQGKERRIASQMLDAFDAETSPLAPELAEARRVSSRYLQSDVINNLIETAGKNASTYSGSGYENALRNQFRAVDKKITNDRMSFAPAVEAAISQVNEGTRWSNAMRQLGKAAPSGYVSTGISTGVPFVVGNAFGGPGVGAAASAATMLGGSIAKGAAERATSRYAKAAEALARNGGAIDLPPLLDDETQRAIRATLLGQGSQYIPR